MHDLSLCPFEACALLGYIIKVSSIPVLVLLEICFIPVLVFVKVSSNPVLILIMLSNIPVLVLIKVSFIPGNRVSSENPSGSCRPLPRRCLFDLKSIYFSFECR